MKTPGFVILLVCAMGCISGNGCKPKSPDFVWSLEMVRQLSPTNTTKISFEEKDGEIIVVVYDQRGRPFIHTLEYDVSVSKGQVLELLKQKQSELESHQQR
jgi:hypothetical protein